MCLSTICPQAPKNTFDIINTYLTGSYSRQDCVIIAFIFSSSVALASARLAVCVTGNYLTHIRNTLQPTQPTTPALTHCCKEQHGAGCACAETAAHTKHRCPDGVLGVLTPLHGVSVPVNPLEKSALGHSEPWALFAPYTQTCVTHPAFFKGKLCVEQFMVSSIFKLVFKVQTI